MVVRTAPGERLAERAVAEADLQQSAAFDGLLRCATAGEPGDVYNLESGVETSIRELAETINRMAENDAPVELLPAREWDRSGHRFGSTEKARRELGFEARVPLDDGLATTIDWMREHLGLIDACVQRHAKHMSLPRELAAPLS